MRVLPQKICSGYSIVQSFFDSPLDCITVSKDLFVQCISGAKRYVYVTTPYLIFDEEMRDTFCRASMSGGDVRIVMPSVADKKIVTWLRKSYYFDLLEMGVRIYEYTPGLVHANQHLCDRSVADGGTTNM